VGDCNPRIIIKPGGLEPAARAKIIGFVSNSKPHNAPLRQNSRPYSLRLKIWSRWCARSSIMLPHTWKDTNSPGNSDCLSSNGHRPTLPSIPRILHIGVSRVRVTMSSTLTIRHQLSDMTCCLPNRFAMRSRGFCAIYRAFKSPGRSLVTRLGLIRRLEVNSVRKCERL
jgi:hypothetical protein